MGVGGQRHAPRTLYSWENPGTRHRKLDGPQGRSGRVRKISFLPEFDPGIVQAVASRYDD
jgi:hypothetical protein